MSRVKEKGEKKKEMRVSRREEEKGDRKGEKGERRGKRGKKNIGKMGLSKRSHSVLPTPNDA